MVLPKWAPEPVHPLLRAGLALVVQAISALAGSVTRRKPLTAHRACLTAHVGGRKMKHTSIDDPIRLGKSFWLTYCLMLGPSLWLLHPWTWELPLYAEIIGAVFPPFLSSIALYTLVLFTLSLTSNFKDQKRSLAGFVASIVGPSIFFVAAWIYSGYQNLPAICAFVSSFIGYSIFYLTYRRRLNQPPEPTAASDPGSS
jgi:hypothetical protein